MKVVELSPEEFEEVRRIKAEIAASKRRMKEFYDELCAKYGANAQSSDDLRYLIIK